LRILGIKSPSCYFKKVAGGNVVAGDDSLIATLKVLKEELGIIIDPQNGRMIYLPT